MQKNNGYLFRFSIAVMRSFSILQEGIVPYMSNLVTQLTQKIITVSKVRKSHMQIYLFLKPILFYRS